MDLIEGVAVECDPVEEFLLDMLKRHRESKKSAIAGKYRKGGSGTVFQRFDEQLQRDIAVKVIDYSDSKDQEKAIVDLKREYHNLESLDHPSIVRFLGFTHNELAKQAIIQMEWAATELSESPAGRAALDLADLINQHSDNYKTHGKDAFLPESAIWQILFHLSAALSLCHHGVSLHRNIRSEEIETQDILPKLINDSGQRLFTIASQHPRITWRSEQITFSMKEDHRPIVHRDIKPLLITDPARESADDQWRVPGDISFGGRLAAMFQVYPVVLLGDFGLSAPLKEAHTYGIGTIGYMAPEILTHRPGEGNVEFQWTTACDIFSLGATLIHLMTLDAEGEVTNLPSCYSETLRTLVTECLSVNDKTRPTAFDLLGISITNSSWNTSYISPYGIPIASDFNRALFSSWYVCRTKYERATGLTTKPLHLKEDPIISSAIQLLAQKAKEGKEALRFFIAGAYFLGLAKSKPVVQLPYRRESRFIGRDEVLSQLRDLVHVNGESQSRIALYGLGGIGKTQIALEFAYRLQANNPLYSLYWVYASTASRFEHAYRQIAIECKIPGCDDPKSDWMLLVRDWLESPRSGAWLMVVDNVDDFAAFTEIPVNTGRTLYEYIPKSLNGSLLYTTRSRDIGINLAKDVLRVAPMSQSEASSLFSTLSHSGNLEETKAVEECEALCEALGHIPLAISQAAAYMSKSQTSIARYTKLFSTAETEVRLLSHKFISPGREERPLESVKSTIEMSFEVIRTESQRAHDLLCLIGFLDPEGIPEYLLTLGTDTPLDFEDAIALLMAFSLVGKNEYGDIYNIHRLVHVLIGSWLQQKGDTYKWSSQALKTVATKFPNSDFKNWEVCAELVPHADCVLGRKYEDPLDIVAQAHLLLNLSSYQRRRGRLEIAEMLARESLHLREKFLGQRDPDSVRSLNNLASVLLSRGKYEEALRIQSTALKNLEAASGNWNSDTLISMENYAGVLQKQGDLKKAESVQRQILQRQELMLGEEDLNTLRSYCKLASILQEQYMLVEAEDLYRQALPILKTHYGMEHPETLDCMRDLASLLFLRKEDAEAEVLRSQAVAGYQKILGSEHPDTLTSMRDLALEYQRQGYFAKAEALNRQILSVRERVLGSTHPDTLDSITDLASVLEDEGKYDDAKAVVYSRSANQIGPASFRVPQLQVSAHLSKLANEEVEPNSSTAFLSVSVAIKWRKGKSSDKWRLDRKIGVKKWEDLIGGYLRDRLRSRDHVFLIDDSSSMSKYWKEVADVLGILAYIVAQNDSDGVDACFSGSELRVHGNNSSQLISTLKKVVPSGEPDIAKRLNQMLHRVQADIPGRATSKRFLPRGSRPLSLIILTDGNWKKAETQKAIIEPIKVLIEKLTSSQMDGKQVGIQFISFGDSDGLHKLESIEDNLSLMPLDIVDVEPSSGNVWKMLLGAIQNEYDFDDRV